VQSHKSKQKVKLCRFLTSFAIIEPTKKPLFQ